MFVVIDYKTTNAMKKTSKLILMSLICVLLYPLHGHAQQSVVSAGGDFTGTGGSMSFSTGLPDFYYYEEVGTGSLQFGVQQPFFYVIPDDLEEELIVPNTTLTDGDMECFNALLNITTGGDGKTFLVEANASAELIAGNSIRMLAGTSVVAGGYLHARITTDGTFCDPDKQGPVMAPLANAAENVEDISLSAFDFQKKESLFKVYPNPTTGLFTLELTIDQIEPMQQMTVEVYGMRGERVLSEKVSSDQPHVFSLSDRQPGIYIIRVLSGDQTGIARIIKR